MRSLSGLRADFDNVGRPRDARVAPLRITGQAAPAALPCALVLAAIGGGAAWPRAQQAAAGSRLRIVRVVVEAILRGVAHRLGTKFDPRLRGRQMKRNLPQLHADVKMFPSASV